MERLTILLQTLLANKDGLEAAITAITAALSSSSSTGASGADVLELVQSLADLVVSLEDTIIQSVALDLVKITIITASAELTATEKARNLIIDKVKG